MNRKSTPASSSKSSGIDAVPNNPKQIATRGSAAVKPAIAKSGAAKRTAVEHHQPAAADPAEVEPIDAVAKMATTINSATATEVMLKPVTVGVMVAVPPALLELVAPNLDSTRSGGGQ